MAPDLTRTQSQPAPPPDPPSAPRGRSSAGIHRTDASGNFAMGRGPIVLRDMGQPASAAGRPAQRKYEAAGERWYKDYEAVPGAAFARAEPRTTARTTALFCGGRAARQQAARIDS